MGEIKLVVSDVDGTLVELLTHEVSPNVRDAVIAAEDAGVSVVPVTGRPYEMGLEVFNLLGFDGLCVVDNGASIRDVKTGELLWSQWLNIDTVRKLTKLLLPYSLMIDFSTQYDEHPPVPGEDETIAEPAPYVFSLIKSSDAPEIEEALLAFDNIAYHTNPRFTQPEVSGLQITHSLGTKGYGVAELHKLVGVSLDQTMAIGDGNNDLPLFESAGLKVAMGNATDLLKAQADHVVGTVEQDGFAEAIERFVLN